MVEAVVPELGAGGGVVAAQVGGAAVVERDSVAELPVAPKGNQVDARAGVGREVVAGDLVVEGRRSGEGGIERLDLDARAGVRRYDVPLDEAAGAVNVDASRLGQAKAVPGDGVVRDVVTSQRAVEFEPVSLMSDDEVASDDVAVASAALGADAVGVSGVDGVAPDFVPGDGPSIGLVTLSSDPHETALKPANFVSD